MATLSSNGSGSGGIINWDTATTTTSGAFDPTALGTAQTQVWTTPQYYTYPPEKVTFFGMDFDKEDFELMKKLISSMKGRAKGRAVKGPSIDEAVEKACQEIMASL